MYILCMLTQYLYLCIQIEFKLGKLHRIQTICDIFNQKTEVEKIPHRGSCKLLKIYLTVQVTTSLAERNFSALKRMKTFLKECYDTAASKTLLVACYCIFIRRRHILLTYKVSLKTLFRSMKDVVDILDILYFHLLLERVKYYLVIVLSFPVKNYMYAFSKIILVLNN